MDIPAQFLAFGVQTGSHDAIKLFFGLDPLPGTEVDSCQPQPGNVLDLVQFGVGDHPFEPLLGGRRIATVERQFGQPQCRQCRIRRFREVAQDHLTALPGLLNIGLGRRCHERFIGLRGVFRLGIAVRTPVLPAENSRYP